MSSRLPVRLRKLPELPAAPPDPVELPPATLPADAVEVGRVLAPRGVQGGFRVRPHGGSAEVLLACSRWYLRLSAQPPAAGAPARVIGLDVDCVDGPGGGLSARAQPIASREAAERLQHAAIFIARSDFPALSPGQYYWVDLIGLRVVNRDGVDFGTVHDLVETGPSQALVVAGEGGAELPRQRLIPFVPAWVDHVDLDAGRITVGWQPDY